MAIYDKDRVLGAGEKFGGGAVVRITCIATAVISDGDGNQVASLDAGTSYADVWPTGSFVVSSGSIKIWG